MKTIHIDQTNIRWNFRNNDKRPVISIRDTDDGREWLASEVVIDGPCRIVYDPTVTEGAKVWIETHAPVGIVKHD